MSLLIASDHWNQFLNWTALDDRTIFTVGSVLVTICTFWPLNFFLIWVNKYGLFQHLKTQPGVELPSDELWYMAFYKILQAQFLTQPIGFYLLYPLFIYCGVNIRGSLPSVWIVIRDFITFIAINDTLFYFVHRALHHKLLYKRFHKQHHTFTVNNGVSGAYAHPVEDIFANLIPTFLGALIMSSHITTIWLWYSFRLLKAFDAHCGYNFQWSLFYYYPYLGGAALHDFHHSHNVGCYGSITIFWDWLFGTDKEFVEFLKQRGMIEGKANDKAE